MEVISLYELNRQVRQQLAAGFPDEVWIHAELSDVRTSASGHCYLEFIEKDSRGNTPIARAHGMIWANVYRMLKPYFEQETGRPFASGIKVSVCVRVDFHELYGYSLTVCDIDPTYTIGDMARQRREILRQLEEEGVLTLNKELPLSPLPQRIAVISSATAAGYGDFRNQLFGNAPGFVFYVKLFPALMQGERAEESVIDALNRIYSEVDRWDAVVIIRGGGATSDLSCFDSYLLATNCAQFPLPIITGIGHERDDTVIDCVAHTRVKTPTAAAEFLLSTMQQSASRLAELQARLEDTVTTRLRDEQRRVEQLSDKLSTIFALRKAHEEQRASSLWLRLTQACRLRITQQQHKLELLEQTARHASPELLLQRGYSITLHNGRAVTDATQLRDGDELETRLAKGTVKSIVKKHNK